MTNTPDSVPEELAALYSNRKVQEVAELWSRLKAFKRCADQDNSQGYKVGEEQEDFLQQLTALLVADKKELRRSGVVPETVTVNDEFFQAVVNTLPAEASSTSDPKVKMSVSSRQNLGSKFTSWADCASVASQSSGAHSIGASTSNSGNISKLQPTVQGNQRWTQPPTDIEPIAHSGGQGLPEDECKEEDGSEEEDEQTVARPPHHPLVFHLHVLADVDFAHSIRNQIRVFRLHEGKIRRISLRAMEGLIYLHSNQLLHCDLTPENMFDLGDSVRLTNIGRCRTYGFFLRGTLLYMSPEYLMTGQHTEASDLYSLGCCILEMVTGRRPWAGVISEEDCTCPETLLQRLRDHFFVCGDNHPPLPHPSFLSRNLREVIERLFLVDQNPSVTTQCLLEDFRGSIDPDDDVPESLEQYHFARSLTA